MFELNGYAAQLADIRWRWRLWPTRWSLVAGYDHGTRFIGIARY